MRLKNLMPEATQDPTTSLVALNEMTAKAALYAMKNGLSDALKKIAPDIKLKNITPMLHTLVVTVEGKGGVESRVSLRIDWQSRNINENIIANDTANNPENREIVSLAVIGAEIEEPADDGISTFEQCKCGGKIIPSSLGESGVCEDCGSRMETVGEAVAIKMSPHDYKVTNFIDKVSHIKSLGADVKAAAATVVKVLKKGNYAEAAKLLKKNPKLMQTIPDAVIEYIQKRAGQHKDLQYRDKLAKSVNWSELR